MDSQKMDWAEVDRYHSNEFQRWVDEQRKKGGVAAEFAVAISTARSNAESAGLLANRDEFGELKFRAWQGIKAACFGREDAAATLLLQRAILQRLARIERLAWLCLAILAFVVYKLA